MTYALAATSVALAIAWLPLALRFLRGWKNRRNPVSLAICAALCLFMYTNVMLGIVLIDGASWNFFVIATHVFHLIVVANFYVAFKWSERRFPDQRHRTRSNEYSVPPTNAPNTSQKP
jgi:hypothetical protein